MRRLSWQLVAFLCCVVAVSASAQEYPTKPVTLVIPFAAGGPTDVVARVLAQSMSKTLGQSVIVENALGAGGTIAATKVARARPDGYTVFLHHNGMATSPSLYRKLEFNPMTDYEYIGLVADVPMTLVARKDFPPKDFKELVTYVKANKDKVTLANAGLGAVSHLCGMLFMSAINTELTTVPYKGTAPAMQDLLGGQVDLLCDQTTQTTSHIKSERINVYGVTSRARLDTLPNVPTLAEQGLPGFEVVVWHGLYAPKGTPKPVLDKLNAALLAALKDPTVLAKFAELSAVAVTPDQATPEALRTHLRKEIDKYGPEIKKAGVYAD